MHLCQVPLAFCVGCLASLAAPSSAPCDGGRADNGRTCGRTRGRTSGRAHDGRADDGRAARRTAGEARTAGVARGVRALRGGDGEHAGKRLRLADRDPDAVSREGADDETRLLERRGHVGGRLARGQPDEVALRIGHVPPWARRPSRSSARRSTMTATLARSSSSASRLAIAAPSAAAVTESGIAVVRAASSTRGLPIA